MGAAIGSEILAAMQDQQKAQEWLAKWEAEAKPLEAEQQAAGKELAEATKKAKEASRSTSRSNTQALK